MDLIGAFANHLELERRLSIHTVAAYRSDLQALSAHLRIPLAEADRDQLRGWLAEGMRAGLAPATVSRRAAVLKTFYRWAKRRGHVQASPAELLVAPKIPKTLPQTVKADEAAAILDAPMLWAIRDRAILELLYSGGLRVGEVCALDVDDVDLERRMVWVREGKGGKDRIAPFGERCEDAVRAFLEIRHLAPAGCTDPALFHNRRRERVEPRSIYDLVSYAGRQVGLPGVSPHTLRHSFATHLLEGGAGVLEIGKMLGHASVTTTQRYTQVSQTHLRESYQSAHPRA